MKELGKKISGVESALVQGGDSLNEALVPLK